MATAPRQSFGAYALIDRIGRGGMGETWRARKTDAADAPLVVVKRILPEHAHELSFVELFVNEARVTASLDHPNIARVTDFGQVDGEFFLAIEYVHGRTVKDLMRAARAQGMGALPVPVACFITAEMLRGLQYAHERVGADGRPLKIVHRDISPDNVLLGFDGEVKLVDFGVAKARLKGRAETEAGMVRGKLPYFSPEQARAEVLDARSDLFAVGVTLYRMVCGRLPFAGEGHEAMRRAARGDFVPPRAVNPQVSDSLATAIDRALEVSRDRRFQTAANMETAIRTVLDNVAPDFDRAALQSFVHWAFSGELSKEGVAPRVAPEHRQRIEVWLEEAHTMEAVAPEADVSSSGAEAPRTLAAGRAPPVRPPRKLGLVLATVAAFGIVAGVGTALALSARESARAAAARAATVERVTKALAGLQAVAPERARELDPRLEKLRADAQRDPPRAEAALAFDAAQLEDEIRRAVASALAPPAPPPPAPAPPPAPRPNTVEYVPGTVTSVTLKLAEHNLGALLEPDPTVRAVGREGLTFVDPPVEIMAVLIPPKGPWSVRVPHALTDPAHPMRNAMLRVFELFPSGTSKEQRSVQVRLTSPRAGPQTRDVLVQRVGPEQGHFVMLTGLTRVPALELSAEPPPGVTVVFKYTRDVKILAGRMVIPAPAECALAVVASPETRGDVVVQLSAPHDVLPEPRLPPFSDFTLWNATSPGPKHGLSAADDLARAIRTLKDGQNAILAEDFGAAVYSLETCVRSIPRSAVCHLLLGFARAKSFDRAQALEHYKVFLELAPEHVAAPEVRRILAEAEKRQR